MIIFSLCILAPVLSYWPLRILKFLPYETHRAALEVISGSCSLLSVKMKLDKIFFVHLLKSCLTFANYFLTGIDAIRALS